MEIKTYISSKKTLVAFCALCFLGISASSLVFGSEELMALQKWSLGLIDPNLVVFSILSLVLIVLLLVRMEHIPFTKLGLVHLKKGLIVFFMIWGLTQLITALILIVQGEPLQLNQLWTAWKPTYVLGFLIAMIFGTAFFEEVAFRGFLLPQVYHLTKGKYRLLWAIVISALLFSLFHIPSLIFIVQLALPDMAFRLLSLLGVGILINVAYLRTGSVFVLIAIHALNNAPTPIFQGSISASVISGTVAMALLVLWPILFGNSKWGAWYHIKLENKTMQEKM